MITQEDLFGNPFQGVPPQERHDPREPGLKKRILFFFKDRKYQSFIVEDIVREFNATKATVVRSAVSQLIKSGKLIATGDFRGAGRTSACITLNLHRR